MRYLPREDAPFSNKTWEMIDAAVLGAAKSQLAGRRVLEIVGPSGFGARIVENGERAADQKTTFSDAVATMSAVAPMPIPLLRSSFMLPIREVAAAEFEVVDGPQRLMRWGVPDPAVHDDFLMSAALCALLEEEMAGLAQPSLIIEAGDPLRGA